MVNKILVLERRIDRLSAKVDEIAKSSDKIREGSEGESR